MDITVVKIGSNTVADTNGSLRIGFIEDTLSSVGAAVAAGKKIVLITSGAVKIGRALRRRDDLARSVAAGVGQPVLFASYQEVARKHDLVLAEILISRPYLIRRQQFLALQRTFGELFEQGIIPVVNENDAVVADTDWSFGDNDSLAAALAVSFAAQKLIIVSHIDGLYDADPALDPSARLIPQVADVNRELMKYSSGKTSAGGRGGMLSKLKAARLCTAIGIEVQIMNGLVKENIGKALAGQRIGTVFTARRFTKTISNRQRWMLAAKNSQGTIEIDDGAVSAVRSGKSLLAVGVKSAYGAFEAKEIIEIVDRNKDGVAFGIVDVSKADIETMLTGADLRGKQLMHANNMVVLES